MAYYPPNMGGPYPQGYPGAAYPGMGNYMTSPYSVQPGPMQGYGPGQFPGAPAGQPPYGRGFRAQPGAGGRLGTGRTPAYGPQYQYPGGGVGAPGIGTPGIGAPGMAAPGMGGRRRPGLVSRMAGQQGSPAGLGQPYQPQPYQPQPYQPQPYQSQPQFAPAQAPQVKGLAGKGLKLGRRNQAPGFGPQPGMSMQVSPMGRTVKPKQFTLQAAGAGGGNGIANINDASSFSLIANNLPDPTGLGGDAGGAQPVYMAYLTNRKGQGSFPVGQLYPLGGGTYRLNFQSNVPFYDYDQVVVSLENPYSVSNMPAGPIVLTSAAGGKISLPKPVSNFFKGTWEKIKGIGRKKPQDPPPAPAAEQQPSLPSLLNNYTLGPSAPPSPIQTDLPGLGAPVEDPPQGGDPLK